MSAGDWEPLLERARRRDPQALGALLECFSSRLFGLIYRLTGDRGAAEDLLQETFLRVVRVIGEYDHDGRFEAWLFRIAANVARDHARRRRRRGERVSLDANLDNQTPRERAPATLPGPAAHAEAADGANRLNAALEELSESDREVILLRHFAELSFREIAEIQGTPLGTALARGHRAMERLRDIMGDDAS